MKDNSELFVLLFHCVANHRSCPRIPNSALIQLIELLPVTRRRRCVSKVVFVPCGFLWFKADARRNTALSIVKTAWGCSYAKYGSISQFVFLAPKTLTGLIPGPWASLWGVCMFSLCLHVLPQSTNNQQTAFEVNFGTLNWLRVWVRLITLDNPIPLWSAKEWEVDGRVNVKWGATLCQPACHWQIEWGVRATSFWTSAIYRLEGCE